MSVSVKRRLIACGYDKNKKHTMSIPLKTSIIICITIIILVISASLILRPKLSKSTEITEDFIQNVISDNQKAITEKMDSIQSLIEYSQKTIETDNKSIINEKHYHNTYIEQQVATINLDSSERHLLYLRNKSKFWARLDSGYFVRDGGM